MQRALGARALTPGPSPAAAGEGRTADSALSTQHPALSTPLRVRIGLHTGEPVKDGDDFYGTHVVLAARIASQASGGDILVSALLRELMAASREFALTALPPVALKGLPGEHVVYRVAWE